MKSQLATVGIVVLIAVSSSLNMNLANAKVICIDKYNFTSFIPCSYKNAIAAPTGIHMKAGPNNTNTIAAPLPVTNGSLIYQDSILGIKIQYPSNMIVEKGSEAGSNNVTLYIPRASRDNYLSVAITETPTDQLFKFGLNSNNLDALARQVSLAFYTQNGAEVTNKTKTFIDGAPAYLIQTQGSNLAVKHIQNQGYMIHASDYVILKQDILYFVGFITFNLTKFHPLEQNMIQSLKFVSP